MFLIFFLFHKLFCPKKHHSLKIIEECVIMHFQKVIIRKYRSIKIRKQSQTNPNLEYRILNQNVSESYSICCQGQYDFYELFQFQISSVTQQQYLISIMVTFHSFKRLVQSFDLFCSSELLRYHSQTQYKTMTGGLLSLAIICVVVGGFASMVGDTLNRIAITSSLIRQKKSDPPAVNLKTDSDGMFMMGVSIRSFDYSFTADLSSGPQYFSLISYNVQFASGSITNMIPIQLQKCTKDHWSMVPEFAANYDAYGVSNWLCFPQGVSYTLKGDLTSSSYSLVGIQVLPCNNYTSGGRCAPQADIDALMALHKNFYFNFNYINTVINPDQPDYMSYYVEATDYGVFSSTIGSQSYVYFSDYTINTDDSILPFEHVLTKSGSIVEEKSLSHPYTVVPYGQMARIYLVKSSNSLDYERQVQKISAVLSYMGGLVGAITALLFLIKSYTDTSLEVAIGLSLFQLSKEEKAKQQKSGKKEEGFNLFGFVAMTAHRILKFCGWKGKIERAQRLQKCQQQAIKQMDVQFLLRRVIKLETCVGKLLTPQQLRQIRQGKPITFKSAKNMRTLLFKDGQQDSEESKSEKSQDPNIVVNMKEDFDDRISIEAKPWAQGLNAEESGSSIFRIRQDKVGGTLAPVQLASFNEVLSKAEQTNVFAKTTKPRKKNVTEFAKQGVNHHGEEKLYPRNQLDPIVI